MARRDPRALEARVLVTAGALLAPLVAASVHHGGTPRPAERPAAERVAGPARGETRRVPLDDVRRALQAHLQGTRPAFVTAEQWRCVRALYDRTNGAPLWLDSTGAGDRARQLVQALADVPSHGLTVDAAAVESLRAALVRARESTAASDDVAVADLRLSAAFVGLAEDLVSGQLDPRVVTSGWHIAPQRAQVDSAIVRRVATEHVGTVLDALAPDDPMYAELRRALGVYRATVARGGWPTVPAGPTLRSGDRGDSVRLAALVRRLASEGYLPDGASAGAVYDARVAAAVRRFQTRHAVTVDGALSPETVRSLNVSAAYRAGQIAANLERLRWLPHAMPGRHLIVNVPSFRLLLRDGARTEASMKVVVGAEYRDRATPVFADSMSQVVFQPYWNVTPTIAQTEVVPRAARDPGYLARNDYEVVGGDGDDAPVVGAARLTAAAVRAGQVRVRQRPGPTNALGHAKFLFPNDFNIYLHDTPAKSLFEKDVRAFSHGCIRVEKPAELARWVLGWDSTRVAEAMSGGRPNRSVTLPRKIPVFIIYLTAFTRDGELFFGADPYARDDALVRRLASATLPDDHAAR